MTATYNSDMAVALETFKKNNAYMGKNVTHIMSQFGVGTFHTLAKYASWAGLELVTIETDSMDNYISLDGIKIKADLHFPHMKLSANQPTLFAIAGIERASIYQVALLNTLVMDVYQKNSLWLHPDSQVVFVEYNNNNLSTGEVLDVVSKSHTNFIKFVSQ